MGNGHLGRVVHEPMDMVILAIELYQFGFKAVAYPGKYAPQIVEDIFSEDLPPVFRDEVRLSRSSGCYAVSEAFKSYKIVRGWRIGMMIALSGGLPWGIPAARDSGLYEIP
jgi:hypothetical protein